MDTTSAITDPSNCASQLPPESRKIEVRGAFGLPLHNNTMSGAADELLDRASMGEKTRVVFVNAHCVNQMWRNPEYDDAVRSADYVLPDGSGIAIANVLFSGRTCTNLNGTDLAPEIFKHAADKNLSVYFFGGLPAVAKRMSNKLSKEYPGIRIAGFRQGFFHPREEKRIIEEINAAAPDIILVAMGVPRQDIWLARNSSRLNAKLVMGVGGLFDFLSGRIPRAPKLLRICGSEWVYRFLQEPKRMWKRYILGNPEFLARALHLSIQKKLPDVARCWRASLKRAVDICGSVFFLMAFAPIFAMTAAAIKREDGGPIIFRQKRIGLDGKQFTLLKFRSMRTDAELRRAALEAENGHGEAAVTFKINDDPRITRIGRFIRKYSIDEFPQFLNVLKGDMSLVGPRPALPQEVAQYSIDQKQRLTAKPGLTCTWQISGRADIPFTKQVAMDIEYIRTQSLLSDIKILLATPLAVLSSRGAY